MQSLVLEQRPIFNSGTLNKKAIVPHNIGHPIVRSVIENLQVADTFSGTRLESANGDTVFTLIP
jgi:hypothetical protein